MRRLLVLALVVLAGPLAEAGSRAKTVGTITAVDATARTITVTEVGPLLQGREPLSAVRLTLDDETSVFSISRDTLGTAEWPGGFVDSIIPTSSLAVGDYVVVESEPGRGRMLARTIKVVRPIPR